MKQMLNRKQILAIDQLIEGERNRKQIAEFVGVSRNTLYAWLDNDEFVAEWDRRVQQVQSFSDKRIQSNVNFALGNLLKLAADDSNKRVQAQVNMYLVDRALGRPTAKVDLEAGMKNNAPTRADVLESEFAEFDAEE